MRRFIIAMWVCILCGIVHAEEVRYYKAIAVTNIQPYHLEGLYPSLSPQSEEHYEFSNDNRHFPKQITHHDARGNPTNSEEGWAVFKLTYDAQGRLTESAFYKTDGKLAMSRSLGFAREVVEYDELNGMKQSFYSPKGRLLKTPRKYWKNGF